MTALDIETIYNVVLRMFKDGQNMTQLEQRDLLNELWRMRTGKTADEILKNTVNNRKLCIKRGTRAENDTYIGQIGEITMDTETKNIRVHDGQTLGGVAMARADSVVDMTGTDYVVAWQLPTTENNHTWYRRYKSGWVEQGGRNSVMGHGTTSDSEIILPIEMAGNSYDVVATINGVGENVAVGNSVYKTSSKSISLRINYNSNLTRTMSWRVCGVAA